MRQKLLILGYLNYFLAGVNFVFAVFVDTYPVVRIINLVAMLICVVAGTNALATYYYR